METYSDSLVNAKTNADAPINWMAAYDDIVKISTAASVGANPFDLKYYGDQLIVRTASTERAYNGYYWPNIPTTAGSSYAVRDGTTIMRSWVTTGKEVTSFIDRQNLNANDHPGLEKERDEQHKPMTPSLKWRDHRRSLQSPPAASDTEPRPLNTALIPGNTERMENLPPATFPASPEEAGLKKRGSAAEAVYAITRQHTMHGQHNPIPIL